MEEQSRQGLEGLRTLRKARGLSQDQLAEKSGVDRATISTIETGARDAHVETLRKLANAMDVSVGDFFSPEVPPETAGKVPARA